ncbi:MAG: D-alanyl-D-alanine carboxypeptidase family protein [Oscillospiraceae bacterium]|nr:D-alanyl-D-alanine carboxypeptidase family protein [Oscillospiraceae bacterium]
MSKTKEQKSSGISFGLVLILLIAVAGLAFGVYKLVMDGKDTNLETTAFSMKVGEVRTLESVVGTDFSCQIYDETVASIDGEHLLTALSAGTTTIVAEAPGGKNQVFQLTVTGEGSVVVTEATTTTETTTTTIETTTQTLPEGSVTGIQLTFYSVTLKVGEKKMPIVTMSPADAIDKSENWTSSDEAVAKVDWLGNITAVAPGTCTVRVASVNNPNVYAEVAVTVAGDSTQTTTTTTTTSADGATSTTTTNAASVNSPMYIQGILVANKTYGLPENYNPGVDPAAQAAFDKMQAAAKNDGYSLSICSGFRSFETQKNLYNNYVARDGKEKADTYSARPGHSEHQTGLAFDINKASDSFTDTPEAKWLAENCWKYGFIIRYPKGKESITGYKYESWHIRYLGEDVAKKVYDSGKTLEEYLNITSVYAD